MFLWFQACRCVRLILFWGVGEDCCWTESNIIISIIILMHQRWRKSTFFFFGWNSKIVWEFVSMGETNREVVNMMPVSADLRWFSSCESLLSSNLRHTDTNLHPSIHPSNLFLYLLISELRVTGVCWRMLCSKCKKKKNNRNYFWF